MPPEAERKSYTNAHNNFYGVPTEYKPILSMYERRRTRICQQDIEPIIVEGPCYFLTLLGSVQELLEKNLTFYQVITIRDAVIEKGYMDRSYYVHNAEGVILEALLQYGITNASVEVSEYIYDLNDLSEQTDYTARNVKGGTHYNLGDKDGNFIWDPYRYRNPKNIDKGRPFRVREIIINLEEIN